MAVLGLPFSTTGFNICFGFVVILFSPLIFIVYIGTTLNYLYKSLKSKVCQYLGRDIKKVDPNTN